MRRLIRLVCCECERRNLEAASRGADGDRQTEHGGAEEGARGPPQADRDERNHQGMRHLSHLRTGRLLHLVPGARPQVLPIRSERQEPVLWRKTGLLQRQFT